MSQQTERPIYPVGIFLNPVGQRRVAFQQGCGEQFGRLFLADGVEQASDLLARQQVGLLVIDLERYDRGIDLAALGALVALRAGAPTLVICPFMNAGWLPDLMAFGAIAYAIGPLADDSLMAAVAAAGAPVAQAGEAELRRLLGLHLGLQQALADSEEQGAAPFAASVCGALAGLPGVVHASVFRMRDGDNVALEAQHPAGGLDLTRLLGRGERLLDSSLRHSFPGLLAACTGEIALLDAPAKSGEPELALGLLDGGVDMVLGLPMHGGGAVCLMFERQCSLSAAALSSLLSLAQLAACGLRAADLRADNERMQVRLAAVALTDALTGVANRRRGEELLETEIRRARRYKLPLALIGFDIDHFKAVNDRYGHPVGDAALRTVAALAQAALRGSDVLVRTGGEEFQVIAPHTSAVDGLRVAEKIRVAIAEAAIPGCDHLTISLGVAQAGEEEGADGLTVRVDAALRRAKRAGRNCVELAM